MFITPLSIEPIPTDSGGISQQQQNICHKGRKQYEEGRKQNLPISKTFIGGDADAGGDAVAACDAVAPAVEFTV